MSDAMYQEAMTAVVKGQKARARDLLTRLLKSDQNNTDYWLWMSTVTDTTSEQIFCLENVLKRDPNNRTAMRGLVLLGARPPGDVTPVPPIRRKWGVDTQGETQDGRQPAGQSKLQSMWADRRQRIILIITGVGALIGLICLVSGIILFSGMRKPVAVQLTITPRAWPTAWNFTPTTLPIGTVVVRSPTPTFIGPTPLWRFLTATYTPTARYINTPHSRGEAYRAGLRAYDRGDLPLMLNYMQQAATIEPESADLQYYIGEAFRIDQKYKPALDAYNQAIQLNPSFAPAYLGRARANWALDPKADISKDLDQAIKLDPNYGESYLVRADFLIRRDQIAQALEDLISAEGLLPGSPMIPLLRAQAYIQSGEDTQALQNALEAYNRDTTLLPAYLTLAQAYLLNGRYSDAIAKVQVYLRYEDQDPAGWIFLGMGLYGLGKDLPAALEAFNEAIALDKTQAEAYHYRGLVYLEQKEASLAVTDLVAASLLQPKSFDINLDLARGLHAAKRLNDAFRQFRVAEDLANDDPQRAAVYYYRAQVLEDADNLTAAQADWEALIALPKGAAPTSWLNTAQQHLAQIIQGTVTQTPRFSPTITTSPTPSQTVTPTRIH